MLVDNRAEAILSEFKNGRAIAISFRIPTEKGLITFALPARIEKVAKTLAQSREIPPRLPSLHQAARVAWRIVRDWLESRLAMTQAGMVALEEVFLPYAQDKEGRTVFERMKEARFPGLLLTDKTSQEPRSGPL
jgi:hypothetical protein